MAVTAHPAARLTGPPAGAGFGARAHPAVRVRRRGARRRVASAVLVALGLVGAVVATEAALGVGREVAAETLAEALAAAGAAEEAHRDLHGGYTVDQGALVQSGWVPVPGVEVSVLDADRDGFCLAAGVTGGEPSAWLTETWAPLAEPCQ